MKSSIWFMGGMGVVLAAVVALAGCGGSTVCADTGCGATGGGGSGGAKVCGGIAGATCGADEFCDFSDGSCGAGDQQGVCTPRPQACALEAVPWELCGCDGKVYGDACSAAMAGSDTSANGGCMLQTGQFACGGLVCSTDSQYCQAVNTGDGDMQITTNYQCVFLPAACTSGAADCACIASEMCGQNCSQEADGHLVATCLAL